MIRHFDSRKDRDLREADALKRLTQSHPKARCTYFPMEEKYLVFDGLSIVGEMHYDRLDAIEFAILILDEAIDGN